MQKQFALALREFDKFTNEDYLSAKSIIDQLEQFSQSTIKIIKNKGYVNILDVGSGSGEKAAIIARYMHEKYNVSIYLDSFEPNQEQYTLLLETYKKNPHFSGRKFNTIFNNKILEKKYDYILFLHSLYQFERTIEGYFESLHELNSCLENSGVCIFVIKSPEGDFEKMKRFLFPVLGKRDPVSLYNIQATLKNLNMSYRTGYNVPMIYQVNLLKKPIELARQISFVLFDTLEYQPVEDDQFEIMGNWMRENVHQYNKEAYLNIPDSIIFAYKSIENDHDKLKKV